MTEKNKAEQKPKRRYVRKSAEERLAEAEARAERLRKQIERKEAAEKAKVAATKSAFADKVLDHLTPADADLEERIYLATIRLETMISNNELVDVEVVEEEGATLFSDEDIEELLATSEN